jgi:4-hydroxybenzoate polyprenyltransferase
MAFNRWADAELDARNPRTKMRAIPASELTKSYVGGFTIVASLLSIGAVLAIY